MSEKTTIHIKADKATKESAQKTAKELGLSLSAVINAYLKQFVRNKELHVSIAPQMTSRLEKIIGKAERDLKKGKNFSPVFSTADEMNEYLDSL